MGGETLAPSYVPVAHLEYAAVLIDEALEVVLQMEHYDWSGVGCKHPRLLCPGRPRGGGGRSLRTWGEQEGGGRKRSRCAHNG